MWFKNIYNFTGIATKLPHFRIISLKKYIYLTIYYKFARIDIIIDIDTYKYKLIIIIIIIIINVAFCFCFIVCGTKTRKRLLQKKYFILPTNTTIFTQQALKTLTTMACLFWCNIVKLALILRCAMTFLIGYAYCVIIRLSSWFYATKNL